MTSAPDWLEADGSRGSRAALWAWLRASGVNAPLAVRFATGDDLRAKLAELGPLPICVRVQGDRVEAPPGAKTFLVDSPASIAPVEAFGHVLHSFGISDLVLSADRANGRIGLLLHRCEPLVVQVVATEDDARARHAQLILEHDARDGYRREEDDAASAARALATASDVGGDPVVALSRGDGQHGDDADEVAAHAAARTLSLAELDWQLGKIYTSTEPGPAGAFAAESAWRKVRWVRSDSERIVRRAELAAWVANQALRGRGTGAFEVELAVAFRPAGDLPGAVAASATSEISELIVVDVRPMPTPATAAAALAHGARRPIESAVGTPAQSAVVASAEAAAAQPLGEARAASAAAPPTGAAAGTEDTCKACGVLRARAQFAKTQWKRAAAGKRSCLQCTGGKPGE